MTNKSRVPVSSRPDGWWLSDYRKGPWRTVFLLEVDVGEQTLEVATESCFQRATGDTFCILRSIDMTQDSIAYLACYIPNFERLRMYELAARTEGFDGRTIGRDLIRIASYVWDSLSKPAVADMLEAIVQMAKENAHNTEPPYIKGIL